MWVFFYESVAFDFVSWTQSDHLYSVYFTMGGLTLLTIGVELGVEVVVVGLGVGVGWGSLLYGSVDWSGVWRGQ